MSEKLLPPRSRSWTRAAAFTFDTNRRLAYRTPAIKFVGVTAFPTDWLPWLIYEYGLEDVVPYVRNYEKTLLEGRVWQKRRGTPSGIEIAIGWVNSEGKVAPPDGRHRWWEFQVGFTKPTTDQEQLRQLFGIINLSKASEDEIFRMFSVDYDLRPVRMDQHRFDQNGIMDDYSGAPRWDGGPYISFGRKETGFIDLGQESINSTVLDSTAVLFWFDPLRFDQHRFTDWRIRPWISTIEFDGTSYIDRHEDTWTDTWEDRPWGENGGPEVFVAVTMNDEATFVAEYDDDVWPDDYPERDQSFAETGGSKTVNFNAETT